MNEEGKKNSHLLVVGISLIGYIVSIISFIWRINSRIPALIFIWITVYYCFVLFYGTKGYQKPHGNMVRFLMLVFAVYIAASLITEVNGWAAPWPITLSGSLAAMMVAYMAGRLNKFQKNKYVAGLSLLLLLVRCCWLLERPDLSGWDTVLFILDRCQALFMWLTIVLIYFSRYHDHREAGITVDEEPEGSGGTAK